MEHIIDASGQSLGRLASQVAVLLRGKDQAVFLNHTRPTAKVKVTNVSQILITGNKRDGKVYTRHSGQPGGLKTETLSEVITKKGMAEALKRAIYGMLPANKLRSVMMNNLTISE